MRKHLKILGNREREKTFNTFGEQGSEHDITCNNFGNRETSEFI